jgi:putative CocE/NonD family hydrolase
MDQAEVDKRSDVLKFQTAVLDEELALMGPLMATLYVSSDAIDTDFTVKISDVYPTGEVRILQDNAVRMRWRENTLTPVYMTKGEVYRVEMNLWNTSYVVAPGHALRVSVSSSNFPRFSANPNNGILLADPAYPGANITATNTLYQSVRYPSKVTLPVIPHKSLQLPEVHVLKEVELAYPHMTEEYVRDHVKMVDALARRMK